MQTIDYRKEGWDKFTFRCHSLGLIMVNPKGKSNKGKFLDASDSYNKKYDEFVSLSNKSTKKADTLMLQLDKLAAKKEDLKNKIDIPFLSETCKTYLCDLYTEHVYGRKDDIKNKYLEKGLHLEEKAITSYSEFTGEYHAKNTVRRYNEYIEGEMDLEFEDMITDTKVNWSIIQFIRTIAKPIKPLYSWQLDGYMWLWDKNKGRLAYCLLNTPDHLIANEERRLLNEFVGTEEDYKAACAELRRLHTYDDIPIKEKVRLFEVERSEERIEQIKARVNECRAFLNEISQGKTVDDEEETN